MRITVIGAGYVGLVSGACLARMGHQVVLVDSDEAKVAEIRRGGCPIYETGLEDILRDSPVQATTDLAYAIGSSEVSFICVGTGSSDDGDCIDLGCVTALAQQLSPLLNDNHLVVVKSTVVPGTTGEVITPLLERHGRKAGRDFRVCVNPEFMREGSAVEDFLHPARIIIGDMGDGGGDVLAELYKGLGAPILRYDLKTAEMVKYASNIFLAARLSLINEIGNICKKTGIDVYDVAEGIGYDGRIGNKFLAAGVGFGGSCLPKDLRALIAWCREAGYEPGLLEEVLRLNQRQPQMMIELLKKHIPDLKGREIGVLGLAFKAGTDDVRESAAIRVVSLLLGEGARVKAYDPLAEANFRRLFPRISCASPAEVLECQAVLIVTDWEEFKRLDYRGRIVIDGRRIPAARQARIYEGLCW